MAMKPEMSDEMCRCSPSGLRLSIESCTVRARSNTVWIRIGSLVDACVRANVSRISLQISTCREAKERTE